MKKLILCSALLLASSMAFAVNEPTAKVEHHKQYSEMKHKSKFASELNLSEEQKVKVQEIRAKYKADHKKSRAAEFAEIKSVLTPEQQVKADKMHSNMKMKHQMHKEQYKNKMKENKATE